eukprot:15328706-Ditylum_brightwellii.AAC.1
MHATSLISFGSFKKKVMKWLTENQVWMDMTICRLAKDAVLKVGYLTGVNYRAVHCLDYQEIINDLLDGALDKLDKEEQVGYIEKYGMNIEDAIHDVKLHASIPNIMIRGTKVMTEAIAVYAL